MAVARNVVEPTKDEWEGLLTLTDFLAWSRVGGDMNVSGSKSNTLLVALGADADVTINDIASIDPDEFEDSLTGWRIPQPDIGLGVPLPGQPSAIDKGRARAFHKSCRIAAKLEWSKSDAEDWEWQCIQRQAQAHSERSVAISMAATTVPQPAKLGRSVKIAVVADVTKAIEVPVLDAATIKEAFEEYVRKMHI